MTKIKKQKKVRKSRSLKSKQLPSQSSSLNTKRLVINIFIIVCILLLAVPFAIPILFMIMMLFSLSGLLEPELLVVNVAILTSVLVVVYFSFAKIKPKPRKVNIMIVTLLATTVAILALSPFTIPIYQQYRVVHVSQAMKEYLESKYNEVFIIEHAVYGGGGYIGATIGVTAEAYPKNYPNYRFTISEDYNKRLVEDYAEKYGEQVEAAVTLQLTKELQTAFNGRLAVDSVNQNSSIYVRIDEPFRANKWNEIEPIMKKSVEILNHDLYKAYTYTFVVSNPKGIYDIYSPPDAFDCAFSPSVRSDANRMFNTIRYCVSVYNNDSKVKEKIQSQYWHETPSRPKSWLNPQ